MDFSSIPFQNLLLENASVEQLFSFIKQLDQQFRNAKDEKVRFGNLQILLPIFKAYITRLDDVEKERACLREFLQPWMELCFSQDSMISTESVRCLEQLVSFLMARSIVLYGDQPVNFGQSTLLTCLSQLVFVIEAEPDFIDLKPLSFIESNLPDRILWNSILEQPSDKNVASMDLECCLEILNLFVREMIENQDILDLEAKKKESKEWIYPSLNLIFIVAVSMIPCTDSSIRSKLGHDLLPNLLRWQQNENQHIELKKQDQWCEILWNRTLQMFGLPATNLLRLEIYGLIARFFDFYFGLSDNTSQPIIHKDLRFDVDFFKILQSGLRSNDSLARKYSSYILKRIIDFTDKNPQTIPKNASWTPYFQWDVEKNQHYSEHWDDWFLLYDIMHETVIHLVDPVLPRFETLVHAEVFDPSWWILLLYRGFQNDIGSVKKGLLEFIFSRRDPRILNKLAIEQSFMFGAFFKMIDSTALYQVPTQGTLVSPFGESLRSFILHLINAIENKQNKIQFLRQLIHHLSHVIGSYVPILYTMEALTEVDPIEAWGPEELKSLRMLVDRHRNFNIPATKQFLRKLGISAIVRLCSSATLSFSDIAKTISSLVNEYPVSTTSSEFKLIRYWLINQISTDKTIDNLLNGLKSRFKAYVCDLKSEDIPEAVLRSQANVLARTSVFVVSSDDGNLNTEFLANLVSVFVENLKNIECDRVVFARLLTLLNALWENFNVAFDNKFNFVEKLGLSQEDVSRILKRIDSNYLNKVIDNIVDDDVIDMYISLTRHILLDKDALNEQTLVTTIKNYYNTCVDLLKYRPSSLDPNKEMSKPNYIRLLTVVYEAAKQYKYFDLSCDQTVISSVYGFQMKRTQDALRLRTWGECLARFIRFKWECIEKMVRYAIEVKKLNDESKEFFDPLELYEEAVDQLESSAETCGEAIIRSFGPIFAFPYEKTSEMVDRCVENAIALMKENASQSKTFPLMIKAFIDVIFQPELLSTKELNEPEGPMKKAFNMILQSGELKPHIVAQAAGLLHNYWSTLTKEAVQSMKDYAPEMSKLLLFGPLRDREDQKLEATIASKLATSNELSEAEGTAQIVFSQNDYLVRVYMNDILLRLDVNNNEHVELANVLLDNFFSILAEDNLFEFMFMSTIEHRLKLRVCCSMILLIDFATEAKLNKYLEILFEVMKKETVTSVRCYLEWATVRLMCRFPDRLSLIYDNIGNANHKPNFVISLLTVTFTLGDALPDNIVQDYFDQIFVRIMPWLITNHFTIRLFSYCAWQRNWKSCQQRGFGKEFEENKYLQSIRKFMDTYVDCIKFFEKVQTHFYMTKFDPIKDFNIEFIFRQMMSEFQVLDNEKIGSKSFMKVNSTIVSRCPFDNPARKEVYTSADPSEMMALEEVIQTAEKENDSEEVIQKKIMPWEMMLETDMDLTKTLVQKNRRRNDLIVVASLIDRLPNLAGLCRTCEIFNASQLVVPSMKIKEDVGFTSISVSSERWMPMIEVAEPDVAAFLQQKKNEGYTLCGLEQTTTSAVLGSYEFPEKCVLLLGKERQGVPADLLQMLDVTIEIPQYGITRSLNVHVSGAICIYEYTKQMNWRQQQAVINQQ